jgi:Fe-S-cluster containining protein
MNRKARRKLDALFARLDALYARVPAMTCQGRCGIACGPIILTDVEARRLIAVTHQSPKTILLTPTLDAQGNTRRERCVYLAPTDRCRAYAVRPLICRVWGVVKMLSCMHGCTPERWLHETEFLELAREVERLAGGRVLRTTSEGLAHALGESFASVGAVTRSDAEVNAMAEHTRSLRALHGGRIVIADFGRLDP